MRHLMLCILVSVMSLLIPLTSQAANTYYVDKNGVGGACSPTHPGTQSQPRCTIAQGRQLLSGGDTLYIRGGDYNESIIVSQSNPLPSGTSWTDATTIAGYGTETVTLSGGNGIGFPPQTTVAQEQLFQYIIFKNFKIPNGEGIGGQGCGFASGTDPTPRMTCGLHFVRWQDIEVSNTGCSSGAGGGFGSSDLQFLNVKVHDGGCNHLDHGFYIASLNTLLDGVEVYKMTGYGIQVFDSGCPTPDGVIFNCGENTIIRNSSFHHNGTSGQGAFGDSYGPQMISL